MRPHDDDGNELNAEFTELHAVLLAEGLSSVVDVLAW